MLSVISDYACDGHAKIVLFGAFYMYTEKRSLSIVAFFSGVGQSLAAERLQVVQPFS